MEGLTIEYVVPKDPFHLIDKKINTLENMSAECGALLAKVVIRQSRITATSPQTLSFERLTLVRE